MRRTRTRLSAKRTEVDRASALLAGTASPADDTEARLCAVARALTPQIAPRESYRAQLKDVMMREFARAAAPEGVQVAPPARPDHEQVTAAAPITVVAANRRVDMIDLDPIEHEDAAQVAETLLFIVERARDRR